MKIQCDCAQFTAELKAFPKNTPGRLVCYCDDCQTYMHHLKRSDLLDENGGTEIIPAYPADVQILSGGEHLKCVRLYDKGMYRFSTTCCNTPIANTQPKSPWLGFLRCVYNGKDPQQVEQALGPVRARIMGKFAKGTPPADTPAKFNFRGFTIVMPFILKGLLSRKVKPSPFFKAGDWASVVAPHLLSADELQTARVLARV